MRKLFLAAASPCSITSLKIKLLVLADGMNWKLGAKRNLEVTLVAPRLIHGKFVLHLFGLR